MFERCHSEVIKSSTGTLSQEKRCGYIAICTPVVLLEQRHSSACSQAWQWQSKPRPNSMNYEFFGSNSGALLSQLGGERKRSRGSAEVFGSICTVCGGMSWFTDHKHHRASQLGLAVKQPSHFSAIPRVNLAILACRSLDQRFLSVREH